MLVGELELADMPALADSVNRHGKRARLDRLTRRIGNDIVELSNAISHNFFSHSTATRVSGSPGTPIEP